MRWVICFGVMLAGCGVVRAPSGLGGLKGILALHTGEAIYHDTYGRFAMSFQELGSAVTGADSASAAGVIERDSPGAKKTATDSR